MIVSIPAVAPVTMPVPVTEAFELLAVQVPPVTDGVSVVEAAAQTVALPVNVPATG